MAKRILTLSIEGLTVRMLSFRGKAVETLVSLPFNPKFIKGGVVADSEGLGRVIGSVVKEKGLGGRVAVAFSALGTMSRVLTLPRGAASDLETVVNREARRVMGLSPETHNVHWQLLSGKGQPRVFVLAVPREPLLALMEAVKLAGLTPQVVDLKPLALARAVNQKNAIIAHAEINSHELSIVVDGFPSLMRGISLGDELMAPDMALARILDELSRTISYYNETHRETPLSNNVPVFLTGDLASDQSLSANLATVTGRTVGTLEPPLRLPQGFPVATFMTNIGLGLKVL